MNTVKSWFNEWPPSFLKSRLYTKSRLFWVSFYSILKLRLYFKSGFLKLRLYWHYKLLFSRSLTSIVCFVVKVWKLTPQASQFPGWDPVSSCSSPLSFFYYSKIVLWRTLHPSLLLSFSSLEEESFTTVFGACQTSGGGWTQLVGGRKKSFF